MGGLQKRLGDRTGVAVTWPSVVSMQGRDMTALPAGSTHGVIIGGLQQELLDVRLVLLQRPSLKVRESNPTMDVRGIRNRGVPLNRLGVKTIYYQPPAMLLGVALITFFVPLPIHPPLIQVVVVEVELLTVEVKELPVGPLFTRPLVE